MAHSNGQWVFDAVQFGNAIQIKRQLSELSLRELGELVGGVSASSLSRIERGKTPDVNTLAALIVWLGLPFGRFVIYVETTPET